MTRLLFLSSLIVLVLAGAGCQSRLNQMLNSSTSSTSAVSDLEKLSPEEAAKRIQFVPGDTFEVQQTVAGSILPTWMRSKNGVRQVTVTEFAPMHTAALRWSSTVERPTAASQKAEDAFEAKLKAANSTTIADLMKSPPHIDYEEVHASGTVSSMDLARAHVLALPFTWPVDKDKNLLGSSSAIWFADDAFHEWANTGRTVIDLGVFDSTVSSLVKNAVAFKSALDRLKANADKEAQTSSMDLDLIQGEAQPVEWDLHVNGQDVKVSALRGKNWFGEFVVLNNRQNPLILKLDVNPVSSAIAQAMGGTVDLNQIVGFEVDNLVLSSLQSPAERNAMNTSTSSTSSTKP